MNFHFKHQITHESKIVSDKVNFFADIFDFILLNYGKPGFPALENHKSILKKIKFQLGNYTKYSSQYIKYHFANKYLSSNDSLIKEFYLDHWKKVRKLKDLYYQNLEDENTRNELKEEIASFISILEKSLFQKALENIISAIECPHPLDGHNHVEIFNYNTPLILSEFIFQGFSKEDLSKLFSKILARTVTFSNNVVQTDAPIPPVLLQFEDNTEVFYDKVSEYLANRTLKQQFEGIYYFFKNAPKEKTFVFRLSNIKAHNPLKLNYNEVFIANQLKDRFVTEKSINKVYSSFFKGEDQIYAEVTVVESDNVIAKSNAILKISNALNFLNATLGLDAKLDGEDFILKSDLANQRHDIFTRTIHKEDTIAFIKNNPYEILKHNSGSLTAAFLTLDTIYFLAKSESRKEYQIVHYWRYLEAFFESNDYDALCIQEIVALIISRSAYNKYAISIKNVALQIYNPYRIAFETKSENAITREVYNQLYECIDRWPFSTEDVKYISEQLNHPFLFEMSKTKDHENSAYTFYKGLLFEAYEQRNFSEHAGIFSPIAAQKILLTLPDIVAEFRQLVIEELKKNKHSTFKELIEELRLNPNI